MLPKTTDWKSENIIYAGMSIEEKFYEMAESGRLNQSPVFVVPSIQKRLDSDHSQFLHNFG